jgi:hypothetical protein
MPRRFAVICRTVLLFSAGVLATSTCAANTVPDLGSASNFALLGLNNANYTIQSASTVNGTIGIASGGTVTIQNGTVKGSAIQASAGQITNNGGSITGGIVTSSSTMSAANTGAMNAFSTATSPSNVPNQTFSTISLSNSSTTINGNGGLNYIDIGTLNLSNSSLTLHGTASDVFVLRVSGNFTMSGSSSLLLSSGVTAEHVLIVFTGSGQTINIGIGSNTVNGTLLAPTANTNWQLASGTFNGEIITGTPASGVGTYINLNNVTINQHGFHAVPEPSSVALAAIASVGLITAARRKGKRSVATAAQPAGG